MWTALLEDGTFDWGLVYSFREVVVDADELALVAGDVSDLREARSRIPRTNGLGLKHE